MATINAEKYIEILEHNMLPSRRHLFQERPCIFQQDNANHILHTYKVLAAEEEGKGTWLAWPAVPTCLQSWKCDNEDPVLLPHLKTCLQEEWDKITPETLHHLVSSVPKRLLSVVKRNGNITKW